MKRIIVALALILAASISAAQTVKLNPQGAIPVYGGGMTIDTTDHFIVDSTWPSTLNYNVDGTLHYVQVTSPASGNVFRQTFTYTAGILTATSGWVKQ